MWMPSSNTTENQDDKLRYAPTRMLRLCQAFPIALMFHVNDKGCHHNMKRKSKKGEAPFKDRVQAEFRAELSDVFQQTKDKDDIGILKKDFDRICRVKAQGGNAPLEVLTCMSEIIAACSNDDRINPLFVRELDSQVQRLYQALGSSERIVKTPLPTGFTRHSSRLLFIWSNCLPFALYPLMGPFGTIPTALLTSYAVLGIEDISVQLEEPFDILPLRQYSDGVFDSIRSIEEGYTPYYASATADEDDNTK
jgi:predicted membrane chloride channel (bestrophin family)